MRQNSFSYGYFVEYLNTAKQHIETSVRRQPASTKTSTFINTTDPLTSFGMF